MAIGSHQSPKMKTAEWLTPKWIVDALGPFDLDPCSPIKRPWDTAFVHYHAYDDGLTRPWFGRVWLNPPYSREVGKWIQRIAEHGNGIAFIFARTETAHFFKWVWPFATGILFLKGRLHFCLPDGTKAKGNCGAPLVLIAYGAENAEILKHSGIRGKYLDLNSPERRSKW